MAPSQPPKRHVHRAPQSILSLTKRVALPVPAVVGQSAREELMNIVAKVDPKIKEVELRKNPVYIRVNKFDEAAAKKFAEDMIEECASFPFGKNDDLCDTMSQALMRFREGGLVSLHDDYLEDSRPVVKRAYY